MAKLKIIGSLTKGCEPQNTATPLGQNTPTEQKKPEPTPARWSDFSSQLKTRLQQADNFIPESPMPEFDPILHQQNLNRKK